MTPERARIQLTWLVLTLLTLVSVRSEPEVGKGDRCHRSAENATIVMYSQCPNGCCECHHCIASRTDPDVDYDFAANYDGEVWARCGSDEWCSEFRGDFWSGGGFWLLSLTVPWPLCLVACALRRAVAARMANERAGTGTDQAHREHQHVSEPDIGAAAPSSSTQRHAEVDGVPALERQVTGDSDSSLPAYQAQTVITGVPVSGTPTCTMVTVAGRVAPKLTLAQAGSPLTLADKVEALNTELGLTFTAVSKPAVEAIAAILGMAEAIKGKPLIEQVNTCYAAVFSTVSDPSTVGSSDPRP